METLDNFRTHSNKRLRYSLKADKWGPRSSAASEQPQKARGHRTSMSTIQPSSSSFFYALTLRKRYSHQWRNTEKYSKHRINTTYSWAFYRSFWPWGFLFIFWTARYWRKNVLGENVEVVETLNTKPNIGKKGKG